MHIPPLTAAERMQLRSALGPEVVRVADRLQQAFEADGRADAALWRELLQALHKHGELMETPLGQLVTYTVLGRIHKERGIGHPSNGLMSTLRPRG
jgi:hypothetical protein